MKEKAYGINSSHMITIGQIRAGGGYLKRHLSANDYYAEGERIIGEWRGLGAARIELRGSVTADDFEAIRMGINPRTGEDLTQRVTKIELHDMVISAPKTVSIVAMPGGDERVVAAFREAVDETIPILEKLAAVRDRTGANVKTEKTRPTGNIIAALFHHDTSRLLDPQLHAHVVMANATYDPLRQDWYALQPKDMMEATAIRDQFYALLEDKIKALGYCTEPDVVGFRIQGISPELERLHSQRKVQREAFERRYELLFGMTPDKARIECFIKDVKSDAERRFKQEHQTRFGVSPSAARTAWFVQHPRSSKMIEIAKTAVRALQQRRCGPRKIVLDIVVNAARQKVGGGMNSVVTERESHSANQAEARDLGDRDSATGRSSPLAPSDNTPVAPFEQSPVAKIGKSPVAGSSQASATSAAPRRVDQGAALESRQLAKRHAESQRKAKIARMEALRRLKRGTRVQAAMRGYPHGLVAHALRNHAIAKGRKAG